jgi:hypothetical protein
MFTDSSSLRTYGLRYFLLTLLILLLFIIIFIINGLHYFLFWGPLLGADWLKFLAQITW